MTVLQTVWVLAYFRDVSIDIFPKEGIIQDNIIGRRNEFSTGWAGFRLLKCPEET
jgi:hypothetical protein